MGEVATSIASSAMLNRANWKGPERAAVIERDYGLKPRRAQHRRNLDALTELARVAGSSTAFASRCDRIGREARAAPVRAASSARILA